MSFTKWMTGLGFDPERLRYRLPIALVSAIARNPERAAGALDVAARRLEGTAGGGRS